MCSSLILFLGCGKRRFENCNQCSTSPPPINLRRRARMLSSIRLSASPIEGLARFSGGYAQGIFRVQ
jgi:hypothetical protein